MKQSSRSKRCLRISRAASTGALAGLLGGCSLFLQDPPGHQPVPAAMLDQKFPQAALREDFAHLLAVCEEVHPDLHARAPREQIAASIEHELSGLPAECTRLQFEPAVARVVAQFGDAHTSVSVPSEEWNRFLADGGLLLPFDVECRDGALRVTAVQEDGSLVQVGDELVAIGGFEAPRIVAAYRETHSGSEAFVLAGLGRRLRSHLWLLGARAPFTIEFHAAKDGTRHTTVAAGTTLAMLEARAAKAPTTAPYQFTRLAGDIGYLDFRSMSNRPAFATLLADSFRSMQSWPARGLIVDLRRNGGGDSSLGEDLLAYLTDKPYRMAARKDWKSSEAYRQYLNGRVRAWVRWLPLQYSSSFGREFWGVPAGTLVSSETLPTTCPRSEPRFDGPVCFLIGRDTFSSAMMLADAVRSFGLATVIGEETGGVPNGFGEIYPFDLPNTRLALWVSSARFVRANGDAADLHGVLPDLEVRETAADRAAHRDAGLEAARAWIDRGSTIQTTAAR